jgi:hypothetical protein
MRRFGKWLFLLGFVVPHLIIFVSSMVYFSRSAVTSQGLDTMASWQMPIFVAATPLGAIGALCWFIGVTREANLYRQSKKQQH